jgi:hypothetical protein
MAITFTAGYTFANAEKVTVTKINLAQTGLVLNCATARLLGRNTAGAGVVEELSASTARTLLGLATTDSPTFAGMTAGGTILVTANSGILQFAGSSFAQVLVTTSVPLYLSVQSGQSVVTQVNSTVVTTVTSTGLGVTGTHTSTGGFGCNGASAQTPYASGGTLAGVVAALVANGILSN